MAPRQKRPIAPSSARLYDRTLTRAFGSTLPPRSNSTLPSQCATWRPSTKRTLIAALRRVDRADLADQVVLPHLIERIVRGPDEDQALAYERAAALLGRGPRAVALLPLKLGMRSEEVLSLSRESVQIALKTGVLTFVRKGGREKQLPTESVSTLLTEMLEARPKMPRAKLAKGTKTPPRKKQWTVVGEIISLGQPQTQYQALYRLVSKVGKTAGITVHPHALRHAFATRMARDGAHLSYIQAALGHADVKTTLRYVNPSVGDIRPFLR